MIRNKREEFSKYIKLAKKLGAKEAKVILAKTIATAEWVRLKCQFGCDGFGQSLTCPPYSPTADETRKELKFYKQALLIHGDESTDIRKVIGKLEREIFLDGYYKAFGMAAGPCYLCAKCPKFCRHAEEARPAMEACGIDVYKTVRANGFKIEVLKTGSCKGNYFGVVLIE